MRNSVKKWLTWLIFAVVILMLASGIATLTLYKMVTYVPSSYQPVVVDLSREEQINHYGDKKMEELYNHLQLEQPFEIHLEQKPINELLMLAQQQHWFRKDGEPPVFSGAQLRFDGGVIDLMGRVQRGKLDGVLTVRIKAAISAEGQLSILLERIKIGALSLPDSIIDEYLQKALTKIEAHQQQRIGKRTSQSNRQQAADVWLTEALEKLQPMLIELAQKRRTQTEARFSHDDRDVRIERMTIGQETMKITFVPQWDMKRMND